METLVGLCFCKKLWNRFLQLLEVWGLYHKVYGQSTTANEAKTIAGAGTAPGDAASAAYRSAVVSADELLAAVPGLQRLAALQAEQLFQIDSASYQAAVDSAYLAIREDADLAGDGADLLGGAAVGADAALGDQAAGDPLRLPAMESRLVLHEGDYDAATRTITFLGTNDEPGMGKMPFKFILKLTDDTHRTTELWFQMKGAPGADADGWFQIMEMKSTKK